MRQRGCFAAVLWAEFGNGVVCGKWVRNFLDAFRWKRRASFFAILFFGGKMEFHRENSCGTIGKSLKQKGRIKEYENHDWQRSWRCGVKG